MGKNFFNFSLVKSAGLKLINSRFGSPYHIIVEATTKCNLKCVTCMRSKQEASISNSDMSLEIYDSIIKNLKYPTRFVSFVGMGEQLLNPHLFQMITIAKNKGFEVSLTDNFTLVHKEIALTLIKLQIDHLYASFDSVSKDQFEKMRAGANFDDVVSNIKQIVEAKRLVNAKNPLIFFKSTISKDNFSEIPDIIELAEDLGIDGVDFSKEHSYCQDTSNDNSFYLDLKDLPPTKLRLVLCEMGRIYPCQALTGCFVTFDGNVLPCDHVMQLLPRNEFPRFYLGDVTCNTIAEIWRSEKYRHLRSGLASGKWLPFCEKCPAFSQNMKNMPM